MKKITPLLISLLLGLTLTAIAAEIIIGPKKTNTAPVETYESIFTRALTVGSSGQDVMALKKILSLELGITLDKTATFTTNTANDVKKLQEKYAVEILIPNGLSAGTGYVE